MTYLSPPHAMVASARLTCFVLLLLLLGVCHAVEIEGCESMHTRYANYTDASQITPTLWVGNICAARNRAWREEQGIQHVLNVAQECRDADDTDIDPEFRLSIPLRDNHVFFHTATMRFDAVHLYEAASQLKSWHLKDPDAKMLVHCNAGVSRSMAVALLYMWCIDDQGHLDDVHGMWRHLYEMRPAGRINQRFIWAIDAITHPQILNFYSEVFAQGETLRQDWAVRADQIRAVDCQFNLPWK